MSKLSSLMEAAKQNKKKTAIIAVVVVLVLAALFMRFKGGSKGGSGGGPGGPGGMQDTQMDNVATVAAENPKSGTIERTTSTSGTVEASDVVYVYAKASGDVTGVNVSVGDMVTAGQLLCTINTEQVETAKNAMDSASVNLTEAQSNLSRMQLLYQGGDISDQEWEQYQNQAKTAQLNYESAKLNYDRQVEYSSVTAPISGKIETMDIDVYDHVNQQAQLTGRPTTRGGVYHVDMLPTTCHVYFGDVMIASPNGRLAHIPLSEGISPEKGADINGPTAVVKSCSKMNHCETGGTLLNQKFTPAAIAGEKGIDNLAALIRSYFAMNGHHMQFNVIDRQTLIEAQKNPEEYKELIVRVAGYSDYFRNLDKPLQNEIIERTEQSFGGCGCC